MIKCTVIVLNYFGEKVIEQTVQSLLSQDFPKSEYEIIIVDNNSTDNSRQIINQLAKSTTLIKTIYLDKNHGFAKGNNFGIRQAKGEYVCLLNNDCVVHKNWLSQLYKTAISDKQIFSVTSKIQLYPKYFTLDISQNTNDVLTETYLLSSNLLKFSNKDKLKIPFVATSNKYIIDIPFDSQNDKEVAIKILFAASPSPKTLAYLKKYSYLKTTEHHNNTISLTLDCQSPTVIKNCHHKIQNAGSVIFQSGYSRDIGATVYQMQQNYEADLGQFNQTKEVYSGCGAAILFSKEKLMKIGGLNEVFFMYYEDLEVCERAILCGYKNVYCYQAVANHLHAISSQEWSDFFIYHAQRGHLIHLFLNFPQSIFWSIFVQQAIKSIAYIFRRQPTYFKITLNLLSSLPALYQLRAEQSKKYLPNAINLNFKKIISGYWYVN